MSINIRITPILNYYYFYTITILHQCLLFTEPVGLISLFLSLGFLLFPSLFLLFNGQYKALAHCAWSLYFVKKKFLYFFSLLEFIYLFICLFMLLHILATELPKHISCLLFSHICIKIAALLATLPCWGGKKAQMGEKESSPTLLNLIKQLTLWNST